ncbi:hypothetical protein [Nocardia brasiliensis]|uniref:hypothetical protein n=1 Tax=Nocardia brasiliensis TaxID=37326 RepID=UPI003D7883C0
MGLHERVRYRGLPTFALITANVPRVRSTAPVSEPLHSEGQAQMLRWAYADAGVDPTGVDFIEAHGSGMPLIDPAEFAWLAAVPGKEHPRTVRTSWESSRPTSVTIARPRQPPVEFDRRERAGSDRSGQSIASSKHLSAMARFYRRNIPDNVIQGPGGAV